MLEDGRCFQKSEKYGVVDSIIFIFVLPLILIILLYHAVKCEILSHTAQGKQIEKERIEQQIKDKEKRRIMRQNYLKMVKIHEGIKHK